MRENKAEITKLLEATINATREGKVELEYKEDFTWNGMRWSEVVLITLKNGSQDIVNVAADSGVALIRDVMKHRWFN